MPRLYVEPPLEGEVSEDSSGLLRTEDIWTIHFRPKFGDLFENEALLISFRNYMESSLSVELLEFYLDGQEYSNILIPEKRGEMLQFIISNYFNNSSEKAVNLNSTCYRYVQTTKPTPDALAIPMQQARQLIIRDSLPQYYGSPFYIDFLNGRRDTKKEALSRKKATEFFGELIVGPLCRVETKFGQDRSAILVITDRQKKVNGKGSKLFGVFAH